MSMAHRCLAVAGLALVCLQFSGSALAESVVGTTTTADAFFSANRFYAHYASGRFWLAYHDGIGPTLFSSRDGIQWSSQGLVFAGLNNQPAPNSDWALRYSGTTIIAVANELTTDIRWYRNGTLQGDGTVSWNAAPQHTGVQSGQDRHLNVLIANGRPVYWRASNTSPGIFRYGTALNNPTWSDTAGIAPDLTTATNGFFKAGAIFPTGGADPDDLIAFRATTENIVGPAKHRLVSIRWDASVDPTPTYEAAYYVVSTLGGTLTEDLTTEVKDTNKRQQIFAAVRDAAGNIHAVYVNRNDDVVHYKRDVGFNDVWSRVSTDVTQTTAAINHVALSSAGGSSLVLFYSKSDDRIYYRTFDGATWGAEFALKTTTTKLQGTFGSMEFADSCGDLGLAWTEDNGGLEVHFERVAPMNYRSIGTTSGVIYNTGTADISLDESVVTFTGATLPANIGRGDQLTINPGGSQEVFFILSRDSATEMTVQGPAAAAHTGQPFEIRRAYNALAAWETGRGGDLVAGDRIEVGVVYNDGPLNAGVNFAGNTTNACRYFWLTVAEGHRHTGVGGTGAVVDGLSSIAGEILIENDYTIVEWLETRGTRDPGVSAGVRVRNAGNVSLRNLLVYDNDNGVQMSGSGGNSFELRNTIVYRNDNDGIVGDELTDAITLDNVTIFGNLDQGVDGANTPFTIRNTVSMNNTASDFSVIGGTQANNITSDGTAAGPGSLTNRTATANPNPGAGDWVIFNNITALSENLHLQAGVENDAMDAGADLSSSFTNDVDDDSRVGEIWDVGADEMRCAASVNYRSIGTNAAELANTGTAKVAPGSTIVTFQSTTLPANIGQGDQITFEPGTVNEEILFVLSRDSDTGLTLQSAATINHNKKAYNIKRAYNGLQAWETARGGDLVGESRREVGVAYADGDFLETVTITGSTTDFCHFMTLTAAPGQRHLGSAGGGVRIDGQSVRDGVVIGDDFTVVEWIELANNDIATGSGVLVQAATSNVRLHGLLVHDADFSVKAELGSEITLRNTIIYNSTEAVHDEGATVLIENCTVFNISLAAGAVNQSGGVFTVRNTISMQNGGPDFNGILAPQQSNNISSDTSALGAGSLTSRTATASPAPGVGDWVVFQNLGAGTEDFHLQASVENDALDAALNLSAEFTDDVDGATRPAGWDVGADELSSSLLSDHDLGQTADKFTTTTPVTDVLLAFKLFPSQDVVVDTVRVPYTTLGGVVDADVTSGELWADNNANGVVDAGDVPVQGSVSGAGGMLTFTTNFTVSPGGTNFLVQATVANLVGDDKTTWSLSTADIDFLTGGVSVTGVVTSAVHTQDKSLTLMDHDAGQVGDKFTTTAPVTDVVYQFRLAADGAFTVTAVRVGFTTGGGVANGDVTAGELWEDTNGSGSLDVGDTLLLGGVAPVGGILDFAGLGFTPAGAGTRYFVRASVANLVDGDTTTFSLTTAGIDESAVVTELGAITDATHTQDTTGACAPTINARSIGTNTGILVSAGNASVAQAATTVSFIGVTLPTNIGAGDALVFDPGGVNETVYIQSRDSGTQVTLQAGPSVNYISAGYEIRRAHSGLTAIQDWETARQGDLVTTTRREIGVVYNDGVLTRGVLISGSTTDSCHYMHLLVAAGQRHDGIAGGGAVLDGSGAMTEIVNIEDDFTRVAGLELRNYKGASGHVVEVRAQQVLLQGLLIHDFDDVANPGIDAISIRSTVGTWSMTVRNTIIYDGGTQSAGIQGDSPDDSVTVENSTIVGLQRGVWEDAGSTVIARNTIAMNNSVNDFELPGGFQEFNISSDLTAIGAGSLNGRTATDNAGPGLGDWVVFASLTVGSENFHLQTSLENDAVDAGKDLSATFWNDIDDQSRLNLTWDVGADELGATTAVELVSFAASAGRGSVRLDWETASELDNLGFHVYRAPTAEGPYERITSALIPGLGSSPVGQTYRFVDDGLVNDVTYFYQLEDVETTGRVERHGPVSATPLASASPRAGEPAPADKAAVAEGATVFGEPSRNALRILERTPASVLVELETHGFFGELTEDGTYRVLVPGFQQTEGTASLPVKRVSLSAVAGRRVRLGTVDAQSVASFPGVRPADASFELVAAADGTVRLNRRTRGARRDRTGRWARVASVGFQGDDKRAIIELSPFRWDPRRGELRMAERISVRIHFRGRARNEISTDGVRGRRVRSAVRRPRVLARLVTRERGLYAVRYEDLFGTKGSVRLRRLGLSRHGEPVAHHIEPPSRRFGAGSTLFFFSEGGESNPYGSEAVFELTSGGGGALMEVVDASPSGEPFDWHWQRLALEENSLYQAGLVDAPDIWLWDFVTSAQSKSFAFAIDGLRSPPEPSVLRVWLQGVSDFPNVEDHHVRLHVNGAPVAETRFDGKKSTRVDVELWPGVLHDGANELTLDNVGDTEAAYSMVMLDRFELVYPRGSVARGGVLEGEWSRAGSAEVAGIAATGRVVEIGAKVRWQRGFTTGSSGIRFRVEAGRRYLAVSQARSPEVRIARASGLTSTRTGADWIVIGPSSFLDAAQPLVELRRGQGLRVKVVSTEAIYESFGYGERRPEAIRDFLAHAYHHWRGRPPRFVVLLGDGTYDFKDYLGTGVENHVPPFISKTGYLWTASDPSYGAVNGDDALPDIAVGRLPATSVHDVRVMVEKILLYESRVERPSAPVVLVADDPDAAGEFERNLDELSTTVLSGLPQEKILVSQEGAGARDRIHDALNHGASLVSYVGHGGIHLWAQENIFNTSDVPLLASQPDQPILLTMNCLNGYFHFPFFDALSEKMVRAEGKGAIAAISPSGLSLDAPAHVYHRALLDALVHGGYQRLGDAVLEAQRRYVDTGRFPELLSIYHLFGDPALKLR